MHTVRFKAAATVEDVKEKFVDKRTADPDAVIKRIAELNPHIDFTKKKRIPPGAVLILPDEPGIKQGDKGTSGPEKKAYNELGSTIFAGFQEAEERVGKAVEKAGAERAALVAALKSAIVKRQMEADQTLHKQVGDALAVSELRQKELAEAIANLDLMRKSFAEEYKAMEKLFR